VTVYLPSAVVSSTAVLKMASTSMPPSSAFSTFHVPARAFMSALSSPRAVAVRANANRTNDAGRSTGHLGAGEGGSCRVGRVFEVPPAVELRGVSLLVVGLRKALSHPTMVASGAPRER